MLQDSPAEQALVRAELQAVLDQYNYTNIANTSCDAVLFLPNLTLQCAFVKVSEDCKDQVSQLFRRCAIQMNVTSLWFAYRVTILWYDRLICLSTLRFCIALAIRVSIADRHNDVCVCVCVCVCHSEGLFVTKAVGVGVGVGLFVWQGTYFLVFVLLILLLLLCISLLASTADNFFVPPMEYLSEKLKLSPDIAGITLLALGNGAPDVMTVGPCQNVHVRFASC